MSTYATKSGDGLAAGLLREPQLKELVVLVVDDDPAFLGLTETFLERHSIVAVTETAPENALDALSGRPERFDCIVSDYDMPRMNGIELLEAVRESYPRLPFILYTGKGSEEVASEAISTGVTDYLQKGSTLAQYELLVNRVENAVISHRMQERIEQSRAQMIKLANSTGAVLWMFSADWEELLFINAAYETVFDRSVEALEARPRDFVDSVHPADRAAVEEAMERLSSGETVDLEYRVVDREEQVRRVFTHGEPVFDNSGAIVGVAGLTRLCDPPDAFCYTPP